MNNRFRLRVVPAGKRGIENVLNINLISNSIKLVNRLIHPGRKSFKNATDKDSTEPLIRKHPHIPNVALHSFLWILRTTVQVDTNISNPMIPPSWTANNKKGFPQTL